MTWEYRLELTRDVAASMNGLNAAGSEGWEVCGMSPSTDGLIAIVMKRQVPTKRGGAGLSHIPGL